MSRPTHVVDPETGRMWPIPQGGADDEPPPPPAPEPDPKTFTQDELDRIVGERLARERAKYADYDDMKAKADQFDELQQQQKSELEKAQEAAERYRTEAEQARAAAAETQLRAAIVAEASKRGAVDPEAVVALIDRQSIDTDDAGTPTNVNDVVDQLLQAKPYLAGSGPTQPPGSADQGARGTPAGGNAQQLTKADLKSMSPSEIVKAQDEGRLADVLAGKN